MRLRLAFATIGILALFPFVVCAEEVVVIDDARLQNLYEQLEKNPNSTYLEKLISNERENIRTLFEEDLQQLVSAPMKDDAGQLIDDAAKEGMLIASLQERLDGLKADLDLLSEEEREFYGPDAPAQLEGDRFRLTKSWSELRARKAILEERITLIQSFLDLQEKRLAQIQRQQILKQFGLLIGIGKYILIVFLVLYAEKITRTRLLSHIADDNRRYALTKLFTTIVYVFLVAWLFGVIVTKNPGILASVAIIGAGLAIALQDVVKDVVGWIVIVQNRLLSRGHRITIGTITGEVVNFSPLRTTLLEIGIPRRDDPYQVIERTGRLLSIPNAAFLTQPLTNHSTTSDYVRAEMRIVVTYESNWRKAKEILLRILESETKQYLEEDQRQSRRRSKAFFIPHRTSGNQVFVDIASDGVELMLRFTVPIGDRRPIVSHISECILEQFKAEPDLDLAYRTVRSVSPTPSPAPHIEDDSKPL